MTSAAASGPSCLVPLWLWPLHHRHLLSLLPPPSAICLLFVFLSTPTGPKPTRSSLLVQPRVIKARKQLESLSNMQFVSLQGGKSLRKSPFMFGLMKPVRIPRHHIDSCWLADCSLTVKLHHFIRNVLIPTCVRQSASLLCLKAVRWQSASYTPHFPFCFIPFNDFLLSYWTFASGKTH